VISSKAGSSAFHEGLPNKALHWTAFPLYAVAAGELGRYTYSLSTANYQPVT